MTKFDLLIFYS